MTAHALLITHHDATDYQTLRAVAVRLEDDQPRNISPTEYQPDPLAGLTVTAQSNAIDRYNDGAAYSYAHRIGITTDEPAELGQVAASLATLRKIDKSLAKARAAYGDPRTFGGLVARVATALAVPIIIGRSGADGMYSSGQWQTWTPGDAAEIIDGWTVTYHKSAAG